MGLGVATAAGVGTERLLWALRRGRALFAGDYSRHFTPTSEALQAWVPLCDAELRARLGERLCRRVRVRSRTTLLAATAALDLLDSLPGALRDRLPHLRVALVSSTTVAGMDRTHVYAFARFCGDAGSPEDVAEHHPGAHAAVLAELLPFDVIPFTVSTACSSSANAIILGDRLVRSGVVDAAMVGGADALCAYVLAGFDALKLLSAGHSHPLSEERDGLNLGEAAAYLMLASDDVARRLAPDARHRLVGCASTCDAFNHTTTSANGRAVQAAMTQALEEARLTCADIDCVNAHGTGTPNNDASEAAALRAIFADGKKPRVCSTKGMFGHTLAAAGSLEAIITLLSLRERTSWGTTGLLTPLLEGDFGLRPEAEAAELTTGLSLNIGFGGSATALVLQ